MSKTVQLCQERGWGVGTRLRGFEGGKEDVIQITAIGRRMVLAARLDGGVVQADRETSWDLTYRDWVLA